MDLNNSNYSSLEIPIGLQFSFSRSIQFLLIILVNIPSTICSIFLIYYFFTKREIRHALQNHTIIVLLVVILLIQFIDMPLYLNYFRLGFVWPQNSTICFSWWYINYALYGTVVILLAWTSFERHLLVFHNHFVSTKVKQWLFHYCPLIFFTCYPFIFYLLVLLIPSCNNKFLFDYTDDLCGYSPCYYADKVWNLYDILINGIIPCFLIAFFSIVLLLRIIWKRRVCFGRPVQWRRYRKITIQLLLIASIFVCFNLPLLIYYLMDICGRLPLNTTPELVRYFLFLANFAALFLPFVMLFHYQNDTGD